MPSLPDSFTSSENELTQEIDVSSIFDVDLSDSPRLMDELGQACLDRIRDRCEDDNKDIFDKPFVKYSKEYINSDTFKDFDKSASDKNMTLTGRMLEDIDFTKSGNTLKLEVTDNHGKAYNHQEGDKVPQRAWFGISKKDIADIKSQFSGDFERVRAGKTVRPIRSVLSLLASREVAESTTQSTFADLFGASGISFNLDDL